MQYRKFGKLDFEVSAVGLGTWVTGGWMWGGSDESESEQAIAAAISAGITLIDTAPIYGFGRSEEIVGRVLKRSGVRGKIVLATKCGLEWSDDHKKIRRNSSRQRILKEIEDSRRRLQTDVIDIYQVHWPDPGAPIRETMETLQELFQRKIIRAIGVSNFDVRQMEEAMSVAPVHSLQPPYNLFEREIETGILPFCRKHGLAVLGYGAICRGLLSGKMTMDAHFKGDDIRKIDPKFKKDRLRAYLDAVEDLKTLAVSRGGTVSQLAIQWAAREKGATVALVGARTAGQASENAAAFNWVLNEKDFEQIDRIVGDRIKQPVGPEFMGPPRKS